MMYVLPDGTTWTDSVGGSWVWDGDATVTPGELEGVSTVEQIL